MNLPAHRANLANPAQPDQPDRADRPDQRGPALRRRRLLGQALALMPWAALAGCASPWPPVPAGTGSSSARQRLRDSADAHGAAAWATLKDLNLAVDGPGASTIGSAGGLAGRAQVRWLPAAGVMALRSTNAANAANPANPADAANPANPASPTDASDSAHRLTLWRRWGPDPAQRAWRDAVPVTDPATLAAAAHQADLLRLLWLGPVAVADQPGLVTWAEPETLDGRRCDHLHLTGLPGPDGVEPSRLSLFIDRDQGWLRRLRLSVDDRIAAGGMLQIDLAEQHRRHGVLWPLSWRATQPQAALRAAPVAWRLTGLDVDRGVRPDQIAGPAWSGVATAPARPLAPG